MRAFLCILSLTLIGVSGVNRALHPGGGDFQVYYTAAERLVSGEGPYQLLPGEEPFKYPPPSLLVFVPFLLVPLHVARLLFGALLTLSALVSALLIYKETRLEWRGFAAASALAVLGSLRFLDGEFQIAQVGSILILALLLWGRSMIREQGVFGSLLTPLLVMKPYFYLSHATLLNRRNIVRSAKYFSPAALIFLVPDPRLWATWTEQIRRSTPLIPFEPFMVNLQGFYPFCAWFLGWNPYSPLPLALWAVVALWLYVRLPSFDLAEVGSVTQLRQAFFLSLLSWAFLGILGSPLPWQYTYTVLWPGLLLSLAIATPRESWCLTGASVFLGLTPSGIVGQAISKWLEGHQSVFLMSLVILFIWVHQCRRLFLSSRAEAVPPAP